MKLDDVQALLPVIVVVGWAITLLVADLWIPRQRKGVTALLAAFGLIVALGITLAQSGVPAIAFSGMAVVDGFGVFLNVIFLSCGLTAIALAYDYLKRLNIEHGEYYVLLMFSISGMMLMAYAYDLIMVFLAIELLSIPLYVLAGIARPRLDSEEASLKYFFLGAFSSGFILYGIALVFGATQHTDLPGIMASLSEPLTNPVLMAVGAGLVLVGIAFKIAAVPFHQWAPDVYQGAPSSVSSFMAVAVKTAGFAALLRVFVSAFGGLSGVLTPIFFALAALTMLGGNVLAVAQSNIKRLLAYSSIANAGYLLMAFTPFGQGQILKDSLASVLFYLVAYGLTTLGAWAVVIAMEQADGKNLELKDFAGLGRKHPWLAVAMTVFMLSFTGMPLTLGFWGKLYLFRTAVEGGFLSLALIGLLTSVVSAFYYLRLVVIMYMQPGDPVVQNDVWAQTLAVVLALAVFILSFMPGILLDLASKALFYQ